MRICLLHATHYKNKSFYNKCLFNFKANLNIIKRKLLLFNEKPLVYNFLTMYVLNCSLFWFILHEKGYVSPVKEKALSIKYILR